MKIGFDAKRYFHNRTGLGNYSRDLVNGLCKYYTEHHYYLFDKHPDLTLLPANAEAITPRANGLLWRSLGMARDIERYQLDVFHGLSNELPLTQIQGNTKKIVTIHDVIYRLFPEQYAWLDRTIYHQKTKLAIKHADTIIATSKATANDLIRLYNADEKKVSVVYQTCSDNHWQTYDSSTLDAFKNKYSLSHAFVLYVSSFQTRKNHLQLLKGLKASGNKNIRLVLAGRIGETFEVCNDYVNNNDLSSQVILLTDISQAELPLLYRSAQSFIYPSMIEGFGIPMIEAACAGLPMAVNNIPVFREIAPDNNLYFDTIEIASISKVLEDLTTMQKSDYSNHLRLFTAQFATETTMQIYTA
ncbi:MAG: glycosyltransferase family 1 protein [Bacteroidota bacterium]